MSGDTQKEALKVKVLLIEDDSDTAEFILSEIKEKIPEMEVAWERSFNDAEVRIKNNEYSIIILDIFEGDPANGNKAGENIWDNIWNRSFKTLIIYSACADALIPDVPTTHPLIKRIVKGQGAEKILIDNLKQLNSTSNIFEKTRETLETALQKAFQRISDPLWKIIDEEKDASNQFNLLIRSIRRYLSVVFDSPGFGNVPLNQWEKYIIPPITTEKIMTGDLYQVKDGDSSNPESYRLIVSPPCDLANKINKVLVAKCKGVKVFIDKGCGFANCEFKKGQPEKILKRIANEPQSGGLIFLPNFPGLFKPMCTDLRDLELIPFDELLNLDEQKIKYIKIASIDSPYREYILWAHLQISARPGIPNIADEKIIDEIKAAYNA